MGTALGRRHGLMLALAAAAVAAATLAFAFRTASSPVEVRMRDRHRGMSYAHAWRDAERRGYGSAASLESLRRLRALGVNWISVSPFGFQRAPDSPVIRWGGDRFSESDARLVTVTEQAHELGIRVMLKPHIWLRPPNWVGLVKFETERDWRAWFDEYERFIVHYAALAQRARMDALCIGNELDGTTTREADWRRMIQQIRARYSGPLTYGAGVDQVSGIAFWDALEWIGVSAYYPLVNERTPSRPQLVAAWRPIVAQLDVVAARWKRPVLFTELGYPSADFGAWRQWEVGRDAPVNLRLQAEAYAAFFEAVWPQPWFAGVYWWKWFSHLDHGGAVDNDHPPHGKPAEGVLAQWWGVRPQ